MKPFFLVAFLLCFILLGVSAALLFYTQYVVYDIKEVPTDVRVSNHYGFNLNTDKLHFGRVTSPGNAERGITVRNQYTKPLRVTIQTSGYISGWIYTKDYDTLFQPGESRSIILGVNVPENISDGDYNGTIRVVFTRALI